MPAWPDRGRRSHADCGCCAPVTSDVSLHRRPPRHIAVQQSLTPGRPRLTPARSFGDDIVVVRPRRQGRLGVPSARNVSAAGRRGVRCGVTRANRLMRQPNSSAGYCPDARRVVRAWGMRTPMRRRRRERRHLLARSAAPFTVAADQCAGWSRRPHVANLATGAFAEQAKLFRQDSQPAPPLPQYPDASHVH